MLNAPTGEVWLPVEGWSLAYEVSDLGTCRSVDRVAYGRQLRGRPLKPYVDRTGRPRVYLSMDGLVTNKLIAHLVARAFHGPRPPGMVVRHWNDNPSDNRAANLLYGTPVDNAQDCIRNGHNSGTKKTHCPRGHVLAEPNLVVGHNGRTCLACARGRAWVARYPGANFEAEAERYYVVIMAAIAS